MSALLNKQLTTLNTYLKLYIFRATVLYTSHLIPICCAMFYLTIIAATCFGPGYWPSSGISVVFRLVRQLVWQTSLRINRTSRKISELPENGQ